jgi:uncharacterized membrane protein
MSVDEALKYIVSMGVVAPEHIKKTKLEIIPTADTNSSKN